VLPDLVIRKFVQICEELEMTALIEVDDGIEMERVLNINGVKFTGINNRSLETFVLYTSNTKMLLERHGDRIREKGILVVGESGLFTPEDVASVQHAGQVCSATSCLLLHKEFAKQFWDRLVGWAKNMKVSNPVEDGCRLGSVVSEEQYEKIKKLISAARSEGATLLYGDGRPQHLRRGLFLAPTITTVVSTFMQIGQEEVFGPVVSVKEFKTESEATNFGLADVVIFHNQERCDGIGVLHLQWDAGGINMIYRLEGKPNFNKGGMLGTRPIWYTPAQLAEISTIRSRNKGRRGSSKKYSEHYGLLFIFHLKLLLRLGLVVFLPGLFYLDSHFTEEYNS
jgi:hypothetical protein